MSGQPRAALRGQPLYVLAVVLGGWVALRTVLWSAPFPVDLDEAGGPLPRPVEQAAASGQERDGRALSAQLPLAEGGINAGAGAAAGDGADWRLPPVDWSPSPAWNAFAPSENAPEGVGDGSPPFAPVPARLAAGHALMMAAGFASLPLPEGVVPWVHARTAARGSRTRDDAGLADAAPLPVPFGQAALSASRFSADGWVLWRKDTTTPVLSGRPSYGRSQAGAVARFALAPSSGHRPQVFLRGSTTLEGRRDVEGALGLSARPLASVPVRVAVEARLADRPEGTELRPAAFAVTELPPVSLPGRFEGELYMQGGYVGGDYATAFVDGQARVDRSLVKSGDFDLRAGGGAWGGAQEDGARLDIGPSATLRFRVGDARGRIAADYRFRVAGDAEPSSGPALTLSTGF